MCCGCVDRRTFLTLSTGALAAAGLPFLRGVVPGAFAGTAIEAWDPNKVFANHGKPLRVQPILMYATPQKKFQTSWKSWGGIQTEEAANEEVARITSELEILAKTPGITLEFLPVRKVRAPEELEGIHRIDYDTVIVYPATGGGNLLRACFSRKAPTLIYVRHDKGPVYYWYEALSTKYLQIGPPPPGDQPSYDPCLEDVAVDDQAELLWKLRALYGAWNLRGSRIVALGGPMGKYAPEAPDLARKRFGMEILDVPYADIEKRVKSMLQDSNFMTQCDAWTRDYLDLPGTSLETETPFVRNSFMLYQLFKDLMAENDCSSFTIQSCMGTIMPMAETTACLTLELLMDEGYVAFCESDFVVIPAGMLLRYISGRPVFMHNSTFPHKGLVTCAHCTSPRRLDGERYEPARIVTHYESEYGAAPKVEMPKGQEVTFIDPEYATGRWLGFKGNVESNPFLEICRSQQEVIIQGNWRKLIKEIRDSHWMMVYGDWLREAGFAARKLGMEWDELESSSATVSGV